MALTPFTALAASPTGVQKPSSTISTSLAGNSVANNEHLHIVLDNSAGASDVSVVFVTTATLGGYDVEDLTATVPAGKVVCFGHFPRNVFGDVVQFTADTSIPAVCYC